MEWIKAKKKPIVIEAFQSTEDMLNKDCFDGEVKPVTDDLNVLSDNNNFVILTEHGQVEAEVGDYVIQGVSGEMYPCAKKTFEKLMRLLNNGR